MTRIYPLKGEGDLTANSAGNATLTRGAQRHDGVRLWCGSLNGVDVGRSRVGRPSHSLLRHHL